MTSKSKIKALIQLIDDPDQLIFLAVEKEILKQPPTIIPVLEEIWDSTPDEMIQSRIENLIGKLHFKKTKKTFIDWLASEDRSLLVGYEIITSLQYPDLNFGVLTLKYEKLKNEIWLELSNSLTALEKISVVNHILFTIHRFSVDLYHPETVRNCLLNHILDTKQGLPEAIAMLYLMLAQSLNLPLRYIPFPRYPLLGYVDHDLAIDTMGENAVSDVIFYINPSNRGSITNRRELEYHLKKNNFLPVSDFVEPGEELLLFKTILSSLSKAFSNEGQTEKNQEAEELIGYVQQAVDKKNI